MAEAGAALGNPDQAITGYRKLLMLDPPDPVDAHFQLARLLHAQGGAAAEAKRNVLQALEDAPRYRDAQRLLLEMNSQNSQPAVGAPVSKPAKEHDEYPTPIMRTSPKFSRTMAVVLLAGFAWRKTSAVGTGLAAAVA